MADEYDTQRTHHVRQKVERRERLADSNPEKVPGVFVVLCVIVNAAVWRSMPLIAVHMHH
ncbi:MAG: hypothetical protein NTAFB01_31270 [Nitrospira sp.]